MTRLWIAGRRALDRLGVGEEKKTRCTSTIAEALQVAASTLSTTIWSALHELEMP